MSGRVVHFEIPYDDRDRAKSFYQDAFGWQLMDWGDAGEYTIVSTGPGGEEGPTEPGYIGGGMGKRDEGFTHPTVVVDVEDIDTALEKVEKLGGTTVAGRMAVGEMGWAAYFKDSEGNVIGLWQSA